MYEIRVITSKKKLAITWRNYKQYRHILAGVIRQLIALISKLELLKNYWFEFWFRCFNFYRKISSKQLKRVTVWKKKKNVTIIQVFLCVRFEAKKRWKFTTTKTIEKIKKWPWVMFWLTHGVVRRRRENFERKRHGSWIRRPTRREQTRDHRAAASCLSLAISYTPTVESIQVVGRGLSRRDNAPRYDRTCDYTAGTYFRTLVHSVQHK